MKAGNKRALRLFGHSDLTNIEIKDLELEKKSVSIGDNLYFSFKMKVKEKKPSLIRLEYRIDFVKAGGKLSGKIFKITEKEFNPGDFHMSRKHSFFDMSTCRHNPGSHLLTLIVNCDEKAKASFVVEKAD
jgi:hypothetical protein